MYSYNNKNIVLHELVGLDVEVVNSSDPFQIGIKGRVVNETKNLIFIRANDKIVRKIVKKTATFRFSYNKLHFIVDGEEINFRAHERTEKALKFYKKRAL